MSYAHVIRGNALNLPLPDESVDLCVTSPPYFGLRSYQDNGQHYDGQLGSEATPAEFVDALLTATREMMRVLKPTGSIWVNLGDRYAGGGGQWENDERPDPGRRRAVTGKISTGGKAYGLKPKTLIGIPWRYALRCIDDLGLILRAEIIWAKPNGLWFHFVKQPRYYSAVDEIREDFGVRHGGGESRAHRLAAEQNGRVVTVGLDSNPRHPLGKLPGSVWEIATQPLTVPAHLGVDHYAAFPMEWPRRIIRGWSPPGICVECGAARRPIVTSVGLNMDRPQARRAHELATLAGLTEDHFAALLSVGVSDTGRGAATQSGTGKNTPEVYVLAGEARKVLGGYAREYLLRRPTGITYACACPEPTAPTRHAVVLDTFGGTGTVALVASVLGRTGVSVDLSADYCRLAQWRTTDPGERARALEVPKPPPVPDYQMDLFGEATA